MQIPKYVQDLMSRSRYNFSAMRSPKYAAGYTIDISKRTHMQNSYTFRAEIDRLHKWVSRQEGGIMIVISAPERTRHKTMQYATVTIFDPVMQKLEKFIPQNSR